MVYDLHSERTLHCDLQFYFDKVFTFKKNFELVFWYYITKIVLNFLIKKLFYLFLLKNKQLLFNQKLGKSAETLGLIII